MISHSHPHSSLCLSDWFIVFLIDSLIFAIVSGTRSIVYLSSDYFRRALNCDVVTSSFRHNAPPTRCGFYYFCTNSFPLRKRRYKSWNCCIWESKTETLLHERLFYLIAQFSPIIWGRLKSSDPNYNQAEGLALYAFFMRNSLQEIQISNRQKLRNSSAGEILPKGRFTRSYSRNICFKFLCDHRMWSCKRASQVAWSFVIRRKN